jgi:cellulose synthase/poly-beta-1,6-N-acetylglucosamine synthase-like glycosyltransferase
MDGKKQIVSIVVPCYNEEEYIRRCIESLQNQNYDGNYEIIAVDNGSTDKTVDILLEEKIILEKEQKRGPAAVRNRGIQKAKGDIILFIDGDCVASENWLRSLVSWLDDENIGCVAGEIEPLKTIDTSPLEKYLIEKGHLSQKQHMTHPFLPYAATANAGYKRQIFEAVGLFDEKLQNGEDADLCWRMQLQSKYKIHYVPEAVVYHPYESHLRKLFRQKRLHAYGSVKTFKKYRQYRFDNTKSLKHMYWEYRSIIRRWKMLLFFQLKKMLMKDKNPCPVNKYQLILETAWKLGLIQGSLRNRVWYV